jgi:hypothetical protein
MSNLILTTEKQGVFTISLNRLDKKNALTDDMYKQLCQHFSIQRKLQVFIVWSFKATKVVFVQVMI